MKTLTKTAALAALAAFCAAPIWAQGQIHKLALHVDENDPALMNLVLNNAENVASYYAGQGDTVAIAIVAYGPGLTMLTEDSPVRDRISKMGLELDDITFDACGNTLEKLEKKVGHKVPLLQEATLVPSGVVTLIELQEQGYAYARP